MIHDIVKIFKTIGDTLFDIFMEKGTYIGFGSWAFGCLIFHFPLTYFISYILNGPVYIALNAFLFVVTDICGGDGGLMLVDYDSGSDTGLLIIRIILEGPWTLWWLWGLYAFTTERFLENWKKRS